jgi:hypothetical protein
LAPATLPPCAPSPARANSVSMVKIPGTNVVAGGYE